MSRTTLDLDGQSDIPIPEADLLRLGDNSLVDDLHRHSELAPEGAPDPALHVDASGKIILSAGTGVNEFSTDAGLGVSDDKVPTQNAVKSYVDAGLSGKADASHSHALGDLTNVSLATPAAGELLVWNGSNWVNNTLAEAGIAGDGLASASAAGLIELATAAETNAGAAADRAVTPDSLGGSRYGAKSLCLVPFESDKEVTIGEGLVAFTVGNAMDGMDLVDHIVSCHTTGAGTVTIQVRRRRDGDDAMMFATPITLTDEYYVSDGVIDTSSDDIKTGDQIYVDVVEIDDTPPMGLSVTLEFKIP